MARDSCFAIVSGRSQVRAATKRSSQVHIPCQCSDLAAMLSCHAYTLDKPAHVLVYLWGGVRQRGALKALRHAPAQLVGVGDALEEEAVVLHALDAKGVVARAHRCAPASAVMGHEM